MVEWIARDLEVTTLRYQTVNDMVKAIGRPREKLCLYCWTGECPKRARPRPAIEIVEAAKPAKKKPAKTEVAAERRK
jgi:glutamine phosphoribosylpyrophosphate amidotransferase